MGFLKNIGLGLHKGWNFSSHDYATSKWLKNVLIDIPIWSKAIPFITIYFINLVALQKAYNKNYV